MEKPENDDEITHEQRVTMAAGLLAGKGHRAIAKETGLSLSIVARQLYDERTIKTLIEHRQGHREQYDKLLEVSLRIMGAAFQTTEGCESLQQALISVGMGDFAKRFNPPPPAAPIEPDVLDGVCNEKRRKTETVFRCHRRARRK